MTEIPENLTNEQIRKLLEKDLSKAELKAIARQRSISVGTYTNEEIKRRILRKLVKIENGYMSYYTHILICWEGGHVVGYADPEKIKNIASKYVDMYKSYETEYDKLMLEEERRWKERKEKLNEDENKRCRDLENLTVTGATMSILESISSGKAYFKGSEGCLWISGGIYNYTGGYTVLDELKDFFKELWDNKCFGIGDVVCFHESEQSDEAHVLTLDVNKMDIHEVEKGEKWCWHLNW